MASLPTKAEMDELDKLLDRASGILMRWRLKMAPGERTEFPTVFNSIDRADKAISDIADALVAISTELGFGFLRGEVGEGLFPQTYMDYIYLAEDIKTRDPDIASKVNYNLGLIQRELPGAENAKRWLTNKARELGIS